MVKRQSAYRGALLGMAAGDAMGYSVDSRSWQEIKEDYGPRGLLGYDLVNGYADVSSYTQLAAFTCNGLLLGLTRGRMLGKMAPFVNYVRLASQEWATSQQRWGRPDRTYCWLLQQPDLCHRNCVDTRMLDTLNRERWSTPEEPANNYTTPGGLTTAIGVGLFCNPREMEQSEIDRLGMEAVALTQGSPQAFLTGAILAHIMTNLLRHPDAPFKKVVGQAMRVLRDQFGHQYSHTFEILNLLRHAVALAEVPDLDPQEVMEKLECDTAPRVLAGAVYACLACKGDFDRAMIIAVNHSGRSAAVGAIAGAMLGTRLGEGGLPEFYLECLEPADTLRELADDLFHGCPMEQGSRLYDGDWDYKYLQGGK